MLVKKLAILGCTSRKQSFACSAEEMYSVSPLFRLQVEFVKKHYDFWLILSAKYGLLQPQDIIEPYNERSSSNDVWPVLVSMSLLQWMSFDIDAFLPMTYVRKILFCDIRFLKLANIHSKAEELAAWKNLSQRSPTETIEELINQKILIPRLFQDILDEKEGRNEPFESS